MSSRTGLRVAVALAAVVVGAGAVSLFRPGYSPDEEFTLFAVRGIHAHGLPLLPSGLLYDRGLAYSYASWLASLTGVELPAFRALSLLSSGAVLVAAYSLIRQAASPAAGVVSALLVSTSLPFWAAATTGRFYAPFVLACVGVLLAFVPLRSDNPRAASAERARHAWLRLGLLAFVARLLHELAFTLLAIPLAAMVLSWPGDLRHLRHLRPWVSLPHLRLASAPIGVGLIAAQAVLVALHYAIPAGEGGGGTMIRRFFLWQVLNLFERPAGAPIGVIGVALVCCWLLVPARAALSLAIAAVGVVPVFGVALAVAASSAPLSMALAQQVVAESLAYPLDMFWHLAATHPAMLGSALALLVLRLCGAGGEWPMGERAAHLAWVGWVLWFGVIESGITINYVLLPTVWILAAIGIDLVAIGQHLPALWPGRRGQVARGALTGIALIVAADQWTGAGSLSARLATVRPTIDITGIEQVRDSLRPTDRVACTDELACLLLVGRVDVWLALDDYVRERFVVTREPSRVGVYAGAPAAFRPSELFAPGADGATPSRVIVVDVFKEYTVGNSREWLPRALYVDSLWSAPMLETPQARVVEVIR